MVAICWIWSSEVPYFLSAQSISWYLNFEKANVDSLVLWCPVVTSDIAEHVPLVTFALCVYVCGVSVRLWDVDCGQCLRILEGHEELVRCIRFDHKRIISGAYDGWEALGWFIVVSATLQTHTVVLLLYLILITIIHCVSKKCVNFETV